MSFLGRPTGSGRGLYPNFISSLLINETLPSGRPVVVDAIKSALALTSSGSTNEIFHLSYPGALSHDSSFNIPDESFSPI